jgi:hypothetical protein
MDMSQDKCAGFRTKTVEPSGYLLLASQDRRFLTHPFFSQRLMSGYGLLVRF